MEWLNSSIGFPFFFFSSSLFSVIYWFDWKRSMVLNVEWNHKHIYALMSSSNCVPLKGVQSGQPWSSDGSKSIKERFIREAMTIVSARGSIARLLTDSNDSNNCYNINPWIRWPYYSHLSQLFVKECSSDLRSSLFVYLSNSSPVNYTSLTLSQSRIPDRCHSNRFMANWSISQQLNTTSMLYRVFYIPHSLHSI